MPVCDFCTSAPGPDAKRYSAKQLRRAVEGGYRSSAALEQLRWPADSLGLDLGDDFLYGEWAAQVRGDRTDWLLCRPCWGELEEFLEKAGIAAAPPPRRRRWFGLRR